MWVGNTYYLCKKNSVSPYDYYYLIYNPAFTSRPFYNKIYVFNVSFKPPKFILRSFEFGVGGLF
jgi:hypothetical protein